MPATCGDLWFRSLVITKSQFTNLLTLALESLATLLAVAAQRFLDSRIGFRGRPDFIHFHSLAFQLLVVLEKPAQHEEPMLRHLARLAIRVELRIFGRDRDDLMILLAGVDHRHHADRPRIDDGQRDYGFLAQYQHIERIVVLRERLWNKSVVCRIVNRRVENAVEFDQPADLVELILHARTKRNLDNRVELLRKQTARSDVVP